MKYSNDVKKKALDLYFNDNLSVAKITGKVKVKPSTIYAWINEHKNQTETTKPQLAAEKVTDNAPKLTKVTKPTREQIRIAMLREEVEHLRSMCAYFEKMLNLKH